LTERGSFPKNATDLKGQVPSRNSGPPSGEELERIIRNTASGPAAIVARTEDILRAK